MKIRFMKSLAVVIAMVAGSSAFGQDYYAECEGDIETVSFLGGDSCQKDDDCGKGCDDGGKSCDYGCGIGDRIGGGGGGFYGGAEVVFVKPHSGTSEAFMIEDAANDVTIRSFEWDYDPAVRFWAGYENCEGFGLRARYFYYDQDAGPEALTVPAGGFAGRDLADGSAEYFIDVDADAGESIGAIAGLHIEAVDLELSQRIDFCVASATFSGGVRYGQLESVVGVASSDGEAYLQASDFEGWGPTIALDARRPVRNGNLSLVAGIRTSVLFGDSDVTVLSVDDEDFLQERDNGVFVGEVMIGAEYSRCLANGIEMIGRVGWEGQYWTGMPLSTAMGENFSDPSDLFLSGLSIGLGFVR